jgi:hypothetical protein
MVSPGSLNDAQAHQGDGPSSLRRRRSPPLRFGASERRRLRGDGFGPDPMIEFAEPDALNSEVSVTEDCY